MKTLVIAEPGSTHEGKLARMLEMVDLAADAGCDVYKPQWLSSPERLCERRHAPEYLDAYRLIAYPFSWLHAVYLRCEQRKLALAVSVYLPEDVEIVAAASFVRYLKCASFEANAQDMRDALKSQLTPLIVSLGMGASWEPWISRAFAMLHCVSSYPTPENQANLRTIRALRLLHGPLGRPRVGYSDHTLHSMTGALAVAAGAQVVEFHVRSPGCSPLNADYATSRTLIAAGRSAAQYVRNIRMAERMLGEGAVTMPCEESMMRYRAASDATPEGDRS